MSALTEERVLRDLLVDSCPNADALGDYTFQQILAGGAPPDPNPNAAAIDIMEVVNFVKEYGPPCRGDVISDSSASRKSRFANAAVVMLILAW